MGRDPDEMCWAIENETLRVVAYARIIACESAAVVWLGAGAGARYRVARRLSTIGLLMVLVLFRGEFIVVWGEWLQLWKSREWNGSDLAFRDSVLASFGLVVVEGVGTTVGVVPYRR